MEFKIGDIVKVKDIEEIYSTYENWIKKYGKKYKKNWKYGSNFLDDSKEYEVVAKGLHEFNFVNIYLIQDKDTKQVYIFREDGLEKIGGNNMNKDIILKKGDIVKFKVGNKIEQFTIEYNDGQKLENLGVSYKDIEKIERPIQYETIYETKEILDDKEKEYLSYVIRPFRDKITCITKNGDLRDEWIYINFKSWDIMTFPCFKKDKMYKNMEIDKEYTLEELGL